MKEELAMMVVDRERIERVEMVVPTAKFEGIRNELQWEGWKVTFSGAYTTPKMFPKTDPTRIKLKAEKQILTPIGSNL